MIKIFLIMIASSMANSNNGVESVSADEDAKPYTIIDGRVDASVYNGYRRYHSACHVCHGPAGLGGSFAPELLESLKTKSKQQFIERVMYGNLPIDAARKTATRVRESENAKEAASLVMPAFKDNPNIVDHIDDIYNYLKARSDGALGRGRPKRLQ